MSFIAIDNAINVLKDNIITELLLLQLQTLERALRVIKQASLIALIAFHL